jgi:putative redox protein
MGEVKLRWTGERLQFLGEPGYGNPLQIGGDADGPGAKPSDLLPLSLAACTAYDVVEILRKQRQPLEGLDAVVTSTQDPEPPWAFRAIDVQWIAYGDVDVRKAERAVFLADSKYCAVSATLRGVVAVSHRIRVEPAG